MNISLELSSLPWKFIFFFGGDQRSTHRQLHTPGQMRRQVSERVEEKGGRIFCVEETIDRLAIL